MQIPFRTGASALLWGHQGWEQNEDSSTQQCRIPPPPPLPHGQGHIRSEISSVSAKGLPASALLVGVCARAFPAS